MVLAQPENPSVDIHQPLYKRINASMRTSATYLVNLHHRTSVEGIK